LDAPQRKAAGAYYTPEYAVRSLVAWAVRNRSDRLLDPACGDGRFLTVHPNSVGVEQDAAASALVHARAPGSLIHEGDFFTWATNTRERFECAAGNPPFIRYQRFAGDVRIAAQRLCAAHGGRFSSLSSSWAPFVVATATLLKPGGRIAFVVPAEIGHATYARTTLEFLAAHFALVHIVAVQRRIFPELSEDCWLLYADGYGGSTDHFQLTKLTQFGFMPSPPRPDEQVSLCDWRAWNHRLRPFLLNASVRAAYRELARDPAAYRLGDIADVGIGYVTGANDFFHLRPSQADEAGISSRWLRPSVRNGRYLPTRAVTEETLQSWIRDDEPVLLLKLDPLAELPPRIRGYLDSPKGQAARRSYKCRAREPWYVVPDVTVPQAFLTYMSSDRPALVGNEAGCACTNAVHAVHLKKRIAVKRIQKAWNRPLTQLSCELEGHPLGGGLLKLEPREAGRVLLLDGAPTPRSAQRVINEGIAALQAWRHRG
jgi:adenine-specific DNA methylase